MAYDLIVIGAGAAGLMAAGTAAAAGRSVLLLERMEKPARKVRITGKGRCNLTTTHPREEWAAHVRSHAEFLAPAFEAFDNRAVRRFFERLGVKLIEERGGRIFPASGRAGEIADALERWGREEGVRIECHARVEEILTLASRVFGVRYRNRSGFERKAEARAVLVATGGASYASTGSSGDGYALAHALGHAIEPVRPALTALQSPEAEGLCGLALRNVQATLRIGDVEGPAAFGEVAFSERGLEGAAILRLSRDGVDALIDGRPVEVVLDLKPALDVPVLTARIGREREALGSEAPYAALVRRLVPAPLLGRLLHEAGTDALQPIGSVDEEADRRLITALKGLRFPVNDYGPFSQAIVTAGGVRVEEVDPATMQSRLIPGLYFAGEVLDVDAETGGYNLQIAFSTGRLAGQMNGAPCTAERPENESNDATRMDR